MRLHRKFRRFRRNYKVKKNLDQQPISLHLTTKLAINYKDNY